MNQKTKSTEKKETTNGSTVHSSKKTSITKENSQIRITDKKYSAFFKLVVENTKSY